MQERAMLQQAASLIQSGHRDQGTALCQEVLRSNPANADAVHLLAMACRDAGDLARAEELFRKSLSIAPRRPDFHVNLALLLRNQGRSTDARKHLRRALKSAPDFVPGWHQLGLLLLAEGELGEALRCARKLTGLAKDYAPGWELLAAVQQKLDDPLAAIRTCRSGLQEAPGNPRLHYSLAQLLRQECQFEEASEHYENALRAGFNSPDLYRNLAEARLETGEADEALQTAAAGIQRHPDNPLLLRSHARLHWELQAPGDPLESLWQAARSRPQNPVLWQTLVELLNRFKRHDESAAALREALARGCPGTPEVRMLEAMSLARGGEVEPATRLFSQLDEAFPTHKGILLNFSQHLLAHGEPGRAEGLCTRALELDPLDQLALAYLGTAWQMQGDEREHWLMDYQAMVNPVRLSAPAGYPDTAAFMAEVQQLLETLHRSQAHPIEQTVRGGTQTNGHLFRLKQPILKLLEQQIRLAAEEVIARFPHDPGHPLWGRRSPSQTSVDFSGAWSVRLRSEGFHTDHMHPEGWLSSALYIALPGEVVEQEGDAGHIRFGVPLLEPASTLAPRRVVKPEVGTLVLFPSYMWHGTVPFTSEQPRITVAFDLVPRD